MCVCVSLWFPVGSKGRVISVEIREDHQRRAILNYNGWRKSWWVRRGEEWPDNVQFHNADLCTASPLLAGQGFHAVSKLLREKFFSLQKTPKLHSFLSSNFQVYILCVAGCSRPHQPLPGLTHPDSTPVSRSRVCCLPCQVCLCLIFVLTFVHPFLSTSQYYRLWCVTISDFSVGLLY